MNVELMVLTMNMEARLTMVEDGDGVAEVMNVVTRRGHQPTLAPPPALSISIHRMLPSSSSRAQLWQPMHAVCGAELVEEEKTTVSAGEAISISMRTKREEEGELQHQKSSPTPVHQIWPEQHQLALITSGDGLMAVVGLWA